MGARCPPLPGGNRPSARRRGGGRPPRCAGAVTGPRTKWFRKIPPAAAATPGSRAAAATFATLIPSVRMSIVLSVFPAPLMHLTPGMQISPPGPGAIVLGALRQPAGLLPLPAGHGHRGGLPVQRAQHPGLRPGHPGRGGGHGDHQPHPQGQAQRDEDGLAHPAAQLAPHISNKEHPALRSARETIRGGVTQAAWRPTATARGPPPSPGEQVSPAQNPGPAAVPAACRLAAPPTPWPEPGLLSRGWTWAWTCARTCPAGKQGRRRSRHACACTPSSCPGRGMGRCRIPPPARPGRPRWPAPPHAASTSTPAHRARRYRARRYRRSSRVRPFVPSRQSCPIHR